MILLRVSCFSENRQTKLAKHHQTSILKHLKTLLLTSVSCQIDEFCYVPLYQNYLGTFLNKKKNLKIKTIENQTKWSDDINDVSRYLVQGRDNHETTLKYFEICHTCITPLHKTKLNKKPNSLEKITVFE